MSKHFQILLDKMSPEQRKRIKEKADILRREIELMDSLNLGKEEASDDINTDKSKK